MSDIHIGLVGATGLVGSMMRSILVERAFPVGQLRCFASSRSAGRRLEWGGDEVLVEDADGASFKGLDFVLLSAGAKASRELAPRVAAEGAVVIDNSSAWRMDPQVPLVVSEVNPEDARDTPKGIIANPNCTTMIAMPVVKPLHDAAQLTQIVASTYQAVSGTGVSGVRELETQLGALDSSADELVRGLPIEVPTAEVFPSTIANNVLSIAGNLVDDETDEEHKFRDESRKILGLPNLSVTCTCVRVPVYTGHSVSLYLEFEERLSAQLVRTLLQRAAGVRLCDLPTPMSAAGGDVTLVGRIRQTSSDGSRWALFLSGDNLRKGAALNAIQIVEFLID